MPHATACPQDAFFERLRMRHRSSRIYTNQHTPDPSHGIGRSPLADFDRALRSASRRTTLYPAMPYTSY